MKLSVVILNYNVRYFLELCLRSVEKAISNIEAEIIVVDNNSHDDSCSMVSREFPGLKLIQNQENLGFSKGNNIGVAKAKGEYICVLNPDTVIPEDTFVKLLEFAEGKKDLGIVGCKLINGVGQFLPESKRNIPVVKAAFKKFMGDSSHYYANHLEENQTGSVDVLVGAFMFMKRSLYIENKGFDEDYFMYGEDIDLSYKVLKSGSKNYYFSNVTAIHFKGESTLRDRFYAKRFYGAMQIFYKKHFKKNLLFDFCVNLGIKMVYMLRKEPKQKEKKVSSYVFVSNKENPVLESKLGTSVILKSNMTDLKSETEVIFDANVLSYKTIIGMMEEVDKSKEITFKIMPNKANFILGSDTTISRGVAIVLE